EMWERVIAKLRARSMPPAGVPRPDVATYDAAASSLEHALDRAWLAHPNPGRIGAVHRLNRVEYTNAIRDLFSLDVDVTSQLPGDETADGSFDNFADVLTISTSHLERYLSVARQVTRLAVGRPPMIAAADRFEIPLHVLQDDRQSDDLPLGSRGGIAVRYQFPAAGEYAITGCLRPRSDRFEIPLHVLQDDRQSDDLPLGSRGGIAVRYQFPADGEYAITVRLRRQYQDYVMGMGWPQRLGVRVDC